jgi:hypothetical protein
MTEVKKRYRTGIPKSSGSGLRRKVATLRSGNALQHRDEEEALRERWERTALYQPWRTAHPAIESFEEIRDQLIAVSNFDPDKAN